MPDSKFDLGEYVEVKDRLRILYEDFGLARVTTTYELTREPDDKPKVIARALVYRTPDDPVPSSGTSWMYLPGSTSYTKGSEIENAETSAVGRAIGMMGILIDRSIATSNEIAAKAEDAPAKPAPGLPIDGLIGTAVKQDSRTTDFELRQSPEGSFLGFRLKDGAGTGFICEVRGDMAEALKAIESDVLGQRVQVWGSWIDYKPPTVRYAYKAFRVSRIASGEWMLPASEAPGQAAEPQGAGGAEGESRPASTDPEIDALPLFDAA